MTDSLPMDAPAPARDRRKLAVLAVALLLSVGGYFYWRPGNDRPIPAIRTEGLDPEVVATIDNARSAVAAEPKSAAAWGRLGTILFAQDMYADCVGILAEAERLDSDDPRWPYFRGLALMLFEPDQGIAALRRATEIAPNALWLRLRLAEAFLKLDRMDDADTLFRDILVEQPGNPRALLGRGQILSRRGQWSEAEPLLKISAGHPTSRRSARVALAETYSRLGNQAAAETETKLAKEADADLAWPDPYLAAAIELRTGLQPRIDRGLELMRNGQVERANILISEVLRDHPDSDEAHLALAKVMIRAGAFDRAETELRRAIQLNPNLVDGHFLLAGTRMRIKDYVSAESGYLRAIELKPAYGLAHYLLGSSRLKQGKRTAAIDAFRNALRYRPDLAIAHLDLGSIYLEDGKIEEAIEHLDNAVKLDGGNAQARALLEKARSKKKS